MAIFNFLENFFFISLAITFGLLLLLVYHFKERMSLVEKKSDTMNEIITNVVKEMKNLRIAMIQQQDKPFGIGPHQISPVPIVSQPQIQPPTHIEPAKPVVHIPFNQPSHIAYTIQEYNSTPSGKIVVSDESDTESDISENESNTASESEVDNQYDGSESDDTESEVDDDSESELESVVDLNVEDVVVEQNVVEEETVNVEEPHLDVVSLDNNIELVEPNADLDIMVIDTPPTLNPVVETPPILNLPERKMEEQFDHNVAAPQTIVAVEPKDPKKEVYRKMNINQLRTIAITHGLTQDTSKMKKAELIKLLEGLEDE